MTTAKLVLMRHGESEWNADNLFTGWVDVPLSAEGVAEALAGGKKIKGEIDIIYTSTLVRALMTALLAMTEHHTKKIPVVIHPGEGKLEEWGRIYNPEVEKRTIPVIRAWELNERMYGEFQGLNKKELAKKYGEEQVHIWRRSFGIPPPGGESLAMTAARTIPYFERTIIPSLQEGKNVFVAAHGNSLRSIIMRMESLTAQEVVSLELATGVPIVYEYNDGVFRKESIAE